MQVNSVFFYFFMLLALVISPKVSSAELSNKALFYRCYRQITQSFPNHLNALVLDVENGIIDPIDACISVLDKANLTSSGNTQINDINDQESLSVIATFQSLHYSWFNNKILPTAQGDLRITNDTVDTAGPALFYTKSLFTPGAEFREIFSGSNNMESKRKDGRGIKGLSSKIDISDYSNFSPELPLLEEGALIGYSEYTDRNYIGTDSNMNSKNIKLGTNWGGGILGSFNYMMMNVVEPQYFKSDGAVRVPRKWSQSILMDFMCRELPVIRFDDSTSMISSNTNAVSFRKEGACIRCHATMDPMSGVIRNIGPSAVSVNIISKGDRPVIFLDKRPIDRTGSEAWSDTPDNDFYRKPLNGNFLYRTFDGKRIDTPLSSVENLGQVIASLEDPYVCAAKRYYKYFTGVDVNVDDIADPSYGKTLSSIELTHRNEVINLGKNFKSHQSLKQLIEDIMRKPQFRDSAYQISN